MASEEGLYTMLSDFLEEQAKLISDQAKRLRDYAGNGIVPKTEESKPIKKKRAAKDPNQPKAPPSGYIMYSQSVMNDVREEHKNEPQKNIMTIIANKWKDAPEKEHFQQLAQEKKLEYEEQMKAYKESLLETDATPSSSSSSSSSKAAEKKEKTSKPEPKATKATPVTSSSTPAPAAVVSKPAAVVSKPVAAVAAESTPVPDSEKKKHKKHKHDGDENGNGDETDKKKKKKHKHKHDKESSESD